MNHAHDEDADFAPSSDSGNDTHASELDGSCYQRPCKHTELVKSTSKVKTKSSGKVGEVKEGGTSRRWCKRQNDHVNLQGKS